MARNDYAANRGQGLETLIKTSQTDVTLTKIPSAVMRITDPRTGRMRMVPVKAPVDFMGGHKASGKLLVFDAKESGENYRLKTTGDHLREHQRLELIRYGEDGFIAGLLCLQTTRDEFYWCNWTLIYRPTASIEWAAMDRLGTAKLAVNWDRLFRVAAAQTQRWNERRRRPA